MVGAEGPCSLELSQALLIEKYTHQEETRTAEASRRTENDNRVPDIWLQFQTCVGFLCVPVLPGCQGLVAVWLLLLPTAGIFGHVLQPDDHQDAQTPERESEELTERPSETGTHTRTQKQACLKVKGQRSSCSSLSTAQRSGSSRLLPGAHLRRVLASSSSESPAQVGVLQSLRCKSL